MNATLALQPQTQQARPSGGRAPATLLQRKCACGGSAGLTGQCSGCSTKKRPMQRRAMGHATPGTAPPIVHEVLRSPGHPLDHGTRAFFEPRFGHDFSRVRVHTDARAAASAQAVSALAYTVGQHVVFGTGQYAPRTATGRGLMAHELSHAVQQGMGGQGQPGNLSVSSPADGPEREAETVSRAITGGRSFMARLAEPLQVARQEFPEFPAYVSLCDRDFAGAARTVVPARHCFVWYHPAGTRETPNTIDPASTSTYDPSYSGTPDAEPNQSSRVCRETYEVDPGCVKEKYLELCSPDAFNLATNNCCSCAYAALTACGASPSVSAFPPENQGTGLPDSFGTGWKKKALKGLDSAARAGGQALETIGRSYMECTASCENLPWYTKGFCLNACSPTGM